MTWFFLEIDVKNNPIPHLPKIPQHLVVPSDCRVRSRWPTSSPAPPAPEHRRSISAIPPTRLAVTLCLSLSPTHTHTHTHTVRQHFHISPFCVAGICALPTPLAPGRSADRGSAQRKLLRSVNKSKPKTLFVLFQRHLMLTPSTSRNARNKVTIV